MSKITAVSNGDTGLNARTKINTAIKDVVGEDFSSVSVIELSDVTDAGSGVIISDAERTNLGNQSGTNT